MYFLKGVLHMGNLTGVGLAQFAKSKIGTPYVYGAKGADGVFTLNRLNTLAKAYPSMFTQSYIEKAKKYVGKVCTDCSGLQSWYTGKVLGSAQLYSTASERIPISEIDRVPVGATLWKSGHVGVYQGNGKVVEAKGINYGTIESNVSATAWKYALLFDYIDYNNTTTETITTQVSQNTGTNPYTEPTTLLRQGDNGEGVKWVQWELVEAGYDLTPYGGIDGIFGSGTELLVKKFQQSCKISADGIVGTDTRRAFLAN